MIAPALLRVALPYRPQSYLPLALLRASVALRVAGSPLATRALHEAHAFANVAAIGVFIPTMVGTALARRNQAPDASH